MGEDPGSASGAPGSSYVHRLDLGSPTMRRPLARPLSLPALPALLVTVLATLLAALGLGPTALIPGAGAADGTSDEVTVTWPEATDVNPGHAPYEIQVEDATGAGGLYAVWTSETATGTGPSDVVPVPASGAVTMTFSHDGPGHVVVQRCATGSGCPALATSPRLEVRTSLTVAFTDDTEVLPHGSPVVPVYLEPRGAEVTLAWELVDPADGTVVADGTHRVAAAGGAEVHDDLPLALPATVPDGTYDLRVAGSSATTRWGALDGSGTHRVRVDGTAPTVTLTRSASTFYPSPDGYRDTVALTVTSSERGQALLELLDRDGRVVRTIEVGTVGTGGRKVVWDGRSDSGALRTGTFRARALVTDAAGNRSAAPVVTVAASGKKLVWRTWTTEVSALSSLYHSDTGTCSTLRRNSRWRGGLGLESQTRCTRRDDSAVVITNGVRVPPSLDGTYRNVVVDMYGGGRRSSDYAVSYLYRARDSAAVGRREHGRATGWHRIGSASSARTHVYGPSASDPGVFWAMALTDGSRYDVRSFRVRIDRKVLQ